MVELVTVTAIQLLHFIHGQGRRNNSSYGIDKYHAFHYPVSSGVCVVNTNRFFTSSQAVTKFLVQIKCRRNSMRFIQVIQFGIEAQQVNQLGTTYSQ